MLEKIELELPLSKERKKEILKSWFGDAVTGPICIMMTLELLECGELNSQRIMSNLTKKIHSMLHRMNFWNFHFNYLILLDENYFLITGFEAELMNFRRNYNMLDRNQNQWKKERLRYFRKNF